MFLLSPSGIGIPESGIQNHDRMGIVVNGSRKLRVSESDCVVCVVGVDADCWGSYVNPSCHCFYLNIIRTCSR